MDENTAKRADQTKDNYKGYKTAWLEDAWSRFLPPYREEQPEGAEVSSAGNLPPRRLGCLEGLGDGIPGAEGQEKRQSPDTLSVHGEGSRKARDYLDVYEWADQKGKTPARIPLHYVTDPEEARTRLQTLADQGEIFGADTETTGLDPRKADLRLIQITDGEGGPGPGPREDGGSAAGNPGAPGGEAGDLP
jgi:hypothetical protein